MLGSLTLNVLTALIAYRLIGLERVIVVPPSVHKTFWVESDKVSAEYLEQMGYFLIQLALNVTPQSVDYQSQAPVAVCGTRELRRDQDRHGGRGRTPEARWRLHGVQPRSVTTDERLLKVAVQGSLTTFIGDRRVSEQAKSYLVELQYALGKLTIKSFKEVNFNDPLDTKADAAAVAAGS